MATRTIRGIIEDHTYTTQHDEEGIRYETFSLKIGRQWYTGKLPGRRYEGDPFPHGADFVLEADAQNVALSGCAVKTDFRWGPNGRALRRQLADSEAFTLLEGAVREKRAGRHAGNPFQVVLDGGEFLADRSTALKLKTGDPVQAVLREDTAVYLVNQRTGKHYGFTNHSFWFYALLLLAFNGGMAYAWLAGKAASFNFTPTLVIINLVLVFVGGFSLLGLLDAMKARAFFLARQAA